MEKVSYLTCEYYSTCGSLRSESALSVRVYGCTGVVTGSGATEIGRQLLSDFHTTTLRVMLGMGGPHQQSGRCFCAKLCFVLCVLLWKGKDY